MKVEMVVGDVFDQSADVLVFSAHKQPIIGGQFDGRVYNGADEQQLLEARKQFGVMESGTAKMTDSFGFKGYSRLIHTVMPNAHSPYYNPWERLKSCYLNSLELVENNGLKSVVFAVLGAGCAGFRSDEAKQFAIDTLNEYRDTHPESGIETITLVLYDRPKEYHDFVETNWYLKKLAEIREHFDTEKYLNPNSLMGSRMKQLSGSLKEQIASTVAKYYNEYAFEMESQKKENPYFSPEDYNYDIYRHITHSSEVYACKNTDMLKKMSEYMPIDPTRISRIMNLKSPQEREMLKKRDSEAVSFLNNRKNVIMLGVALHLSEKDFCRLVFCCGHTFPVDDLDYEVFDQCIQKKDYEYFKELKDLFESKRSKTMRERALKQRKANEYE